MDVSTSFIMFLVRYALLSPQKKLTNLSSPCLSQQIVPYNGAEAGFVAMLARIREFGHWLVAVYEARIKMINVCEEVRYYVHTKRQVKGLQGEELREWFGRELFWYLKFRAELDEYNEEAIYEYTSTRYKEMNSYLRTGELNTNNMCEDRILSYVNWMWEGLNKRVRTGVNIFTGTVFRGTCVPSFVTVSPGCIYSDPAFLSTSINRRTSQGTFMSSRKEEEDGNLTLFRIESKTGVDVRDLSRHGNEGEVIFRPGTKFKVLSVEKEYDDWREKSYSFVTMEEIV